MNITSLWFLIFLFLGITVFYLLPKKYRPIWFLCLNGIFILSNSFFSLFFILLTSFIIFTVGLRLQKIQDSEFDKNIKQKRKRLLIVFSVIAEILILVVVKYTNSFFQLFENLTSIFVNFRFPFGESILLPIGISYYTLQAISYILDVYWSRLPAEKSFIKMINYISFFPQLVQGPISPYGKLSNELQFDKDFNSRNIKHGVQLMLWGYLKTFVISTRAGTFVNEIFYSGSVPYGLTLFAGLIFYGIQLYANFSGGIDIVRGVAQCFGVELMENFKQPFFSLSLAEFWRRWHISLGEWMKNYVFFPFSMSKGMSKFKKTVKKISSTKTASNLCAAIADIVVFFVVGIWHGSNFVNIAWGLYNGLIIAVSALLVNVYSKTKSTLHINDKAKYWKYFSIFRTFIIITLGWVFDCSSSASQAFTHFKNLLYFNKTDFSNLDISHLIVLIFFVVIIFIVDLIHEKGISIRDYLDKKNFWLQVIFWTVLIQFIALFKVVIQNGGFIYAVF